MSVPQNGYKTIVSGQKLEPFSLRFNSLSAKKGEREIDKLPNLVSFRP